MGLGVSLILIAVGAILAFAVHVHNSSSFDVNTIGIILLVVGIVGLIASLARGTFMGFSSTRERHVSTDGRTVVENERTSSF